MLKANDPVYFMSLAEVEFMKAEANVLLLKPAEAKVDYDNGVRAAFERWKAAKDADDIEFVFPANFNVDEFIGPGKNYEFNQTSSATMLESIWRQKWIAAVRCQAWEAFLETNRTGFPKAGTVSSQDPSYVIGEFAPSMNSVLGSGEFPRRLIYPKTSSDYNKNTSTAIPIQVKLWWHK
ncbi:MAG: SusD/RagB family nutrient-binding outer membrane lipoprotein [Bacteroidales bacterium]|nr:SusD/RagB family nutrient-binding outer membrane lipoprotein [Bacteroidales bacterium]